MKTERFTEKPLPNIFDGEFFDVITRDDDILVVRCNTCGPEGPQLRASVRSNGNLLKHIQRRHPELLMVIKREKNIKSRSSRSRDDTLPGKRRKSIKHGKGKLLGERDVQPVDDEVSLIRNDMSDDVSSFITNDKAMMSDETSGKVVESYIITLNNSDPDLITHGKVEPNVSIPSQNEYETNSDEGSLQEVTEYEDRRYQGRQSSFRRMDAGSELYANKELIALQKELMVREFNEVQEMRREKHRLEVELLNKELAFKELYNRKKLEHLSMKVLDMK